MKMILFSFFICMNVVYAIDPNDQNELQYYRKVFSPLKVNEIAQVIVDLQSHDLPKQTDRITRFDSVNYSGNNVIFNFTFMEEEFSKIYNVNVAAVQDQNFKSELLKDLKSIHIVDNCSAPIIYASLEKGLTYTFNYSLQDRKQYGTFTFSIRDCK